MKNFFLTTVLSLPVGMFAQNIQQQTINYYDQISNDNNVIQTNLGNRINPQVQVQQQGQSSGNFFDSNQGDDIQEKTKCKDCEEVKAAIKANRSSSGIHYSKSLSVKKWRNKFSMRINRKIHKIFSHRKKIRTNYEVCFNWK